MHADPGHPTPASKSSTQPVAPRKIERPSPLTGLVNAWLVAVAIAGFIISEILQEGVDLGEEPMLIVWIVVGGIALVAIIALLIGLIQWRTTTFIVDHEFRIEKRFITTSTTRIDFTKVQSVDITRPLVARLLGLAEVKIDVGGEGGQALRFLKLARAEALRDTLLARMERDDVPARTADGGQLEGATDTGLGHVVYKANTVNIVLGSILSYGFGIAITVAILLVVTLGPLGGVAGLAWLWFTLLAVAWQIPKALLDNWDFTIIQTSKGLRIQRGALTHVQTTLRPNRVQTISLHQSLLMRWAGLVSVRISVLGNRNPNSEEKHNDGISMIMPFGKFDEARYVISLIWPDVDPTAFTWWKQSSRGRWLTWCSQHWFALEDAAIAQRRVMLNDNVDIVPHARVQGLGITQGPLQRLVGVAGVVVQTIDDAPDVTIAHLEPGHARKLFEEEQVRSLQARTTSSADTAAHAAYSPRATAPSTTSQPTTPPRQAIADTSAETSKPTR